MGSIYILGSFKLISAALSPYLMRRTLRANISSTSHKLITNLILIDLTWGVPMVFIIKISWWTFASVSSLGRLLHLQMTAHPLHWHCHVTSPSLLIHRSLIPPLLFLGGKTTAGRWPANCAAILIFLILTRLVLGFGCSPRQCALDGRVERAELQMCTLPSIQSVLLQIFIRAGNVRWMEELSVLNCKCAFSLQFNLFFCRYLSVLVDVNGESAAPIYKFVKSIKGGIFGDGIKWNFTKFLVDKNWNVVDRYAPTTSALSIEKDIKKLLGAS